jgi:hypothetical protein
VHLLSESPTDPGDFPLKVYKKPRDPRYSRRDGTAKHTGWTCRRDSIHATRWVEDPRGIDIPPWVALP